MTQIKTIVAVIGMFLLVTVLTSRAHAEDRYPVIEVVTLQLKPGITIAEFEAVDLRVQTEYIAKRPGFISRESAPGSDGSWLVIVHWRSVADADASMKSFSTAPAAAEFMSMIEPNSMIMKRYGR